MKEKVTCKINGQLLKHFNKNPRLIESGGHVKHPSLFKFYEWSRLMGSKCQKINVNKINSVFIWRSRLLGWIATHLNVSGKLLSLKQSVRAWLNIMEESSSCECDGIGSGQTPENWMCNSSCCTWTQTNCSLTKKLIICKKYSRLNQAQCISA